MTALKDLKFITTIDATFSETNDSLKCILKYGNSKIVGTDLDLTKFPSMSEAQNLYSGYKFELLLNPINEGITLLNYNEVKENIKNSFTKMFDNEATKLDSSRMKLINEKLEATYSTSEYLLSTYFPEIPLYFNLYSQSFAKGETSVSEYFYPNPMGGDAFPVTGEIRIDSIQKNTLIIKSKEQANQEEANRIVKEFAKEMSKSGNSFEIPDFKLSAEILYHYNIKKKIIRYVKSETKIEMSNKVQTKVLEVEVVD